MADPTPVDTRLVLVGPDGKYLRDPTGHLMGLVLTEIPNADPAIPLSLEVEQQCDMEHWHVVGKTPLPTYGGTQANYGPPPAETSF